MAGRLMRAVQYCSYGGGAASLKHVEVPVPVPKKDEVLIKLEATSLNPVDWRIQEGEIRPFLPRKFPIIPTPTAVRKFRIVNGLKHTKYGSLAVLRDLRELLAQSTDVAGEVVEIGSEVKDFKPGDKVVAYLSNNGGGLAEFAVAKESLTTVRPPEVSAAEGAGLPIAGLTAHQALTISAGIKLDGTSKQANILVIGASGGVGHYAVQLAKLGNAHVTATCGVDNIEFVKSLGADEVLDYKTPEGAALKSPSGRKYDVVVHCVTGIPWKVLEPNLSKKGKVIDLTPSSTAMWIMTLKMLTFSKKKLVPLILAPKRENLEYLVTLAKEGKLRSVIDSNHPLSKVEDAWAKSMDFHPTGKIIVEL